MNFAVQLEHDAGTPPDVVYRWDRDTDILSARLRTETPVEGIAGAVEVAGDDGSWLILDVSAGRIRGVEVAVWPDLTTRAVLAPPKPVAAGRAVLRAAGEHAESPALHIATALSAEADQSERTIHFRVGSRRDVRPVRVGRDLLFELDADDRLAGVWLLNVPPFPADA